MKRLIGLLIITFATFPALTSAAVLTGMPFVEIIGPNPDSIAVGQTYIDPGYVGSSGYAENDWHHIVVLSTVDTSTVGQTSRSYSIYGTSWLNPDGTIYYSGPVMTSTTRTINVTGQSVPPDDTSGDDTDDIVPPTDDTLTDSIDGTTDTTVSSPILPGGASTMPYCSGPSAPGWQAGIIGGGCGGTDIFLQSGQTAMIYGQSRMCPFWFPAGCLVSDE